MEILELSGQNGFDILWLRSKDHSLTQEKLRESIAADYFLKFPLDIVKEASSIGQLEVCEEYVQSEDWILMRVAGDWFAAMFSRNEVASVGSDYSLNQKV